MQKLKFVLVIWVGMFLVPIISFAQIILPGTIQQQEKHTVDWFEKRPDLVADFSKNAKLKIFLRKDKYRFDETMILDVSMLVKSDEPVFFPIDMNILITVKNKSGVEINVKPIAIIDYFQSSYKKTKDALIIKSFQLLVGCDMEELKVPSGLSESTDYQVFFDNNLLRSLGNGCIDIKKDKDEELNIFAELKNYAVVIPQNEEKVKTAVGKIKSNTLNIKVLR